MMGYPEDALPTADSGFVAIVSWLTVVFTVLTVAYMLWIRRHFVTRR